MDYRLSDYRNLSSSRYYDPKEFANYYQKALAREKGRTMMEPEEGYTSPDPDRSLFNTDRGRRSLNESRLNPILNRRDDSLRENRSFLQQEPSVSYGLQNRSFSQPRVNIPREFLPALSNVKNPSSLHDQTVLYDPVNQSVTMPLSALSQIGTNTLRNPNGATVKVRKEPKDEDPLQKELKMSLEKQNLVLSRISDKIGKALKPLPQMEPMGELDEEDDAPAGNQNLFNPSPWIPPQKKEEKKYDYDRRLQEMEKEMEMKNMIAHQQSTLERLQMLQLMQKRPPPPKKKIDPIRAIEKLDEMNRNTMIPMMLMMAGYNPFPVQNPQAANKETKEIQTEKIKETREIQTDELQPMEKIIYVHVADNRGEPLPDNAKHNLQFLRPRRRLKPFLWAMTYVKLMEFYGNKTIDALLKQIHQDIPQMRLQVNAHMKKLFIAALDPTMQEIKNCEDMPIYDKFIPEEATREEALAGRMHIENMMVSIIQRLIKTTTVESLGETTLLYLANISANEMLIPNYILTQFEISRLNFTALYHKLEIAEPKGALQSKMIIGIALIARIMINEVVLKALTIFVHFFDTKPEDPVHPALKENLKFLASVLYRTTIDYFKAELPVVTESKIRVLPADPIFVRGSENTNPNPAEVINGLYTKIEINEKMKGVFEAAELTNAFKRWLNQLYFLVTTKWKETVDQLKIWKAEPQKYRNELIKASMDPLRRNLLTLAYQRPLKYTPNLQPA